MTEEQAREFWDTHALTDEYLQKVPPASEEDLPPLHGFADVNFWLPEETFQRLKALARKRHTSYRALLADFVTERLREEQQRESVAGNERPVARSRSV
jgi:hypothetical protein